MNARMHYVIVAAAVAVMFCLGSVAIQQEIPLPADRRHVAIVMSILGMLATASAWLFLYSNNQSRRRASQLTDAHTRLIQDVQQHRLDIIERTQAQRTLAASEARYRQLVENSQDLLWETDASGHYRYVSPQARTILGMEPSDLIGLTPFDLMPVDEASRVRSIFSRLRQEAAPIVGLRNINLHRDGHPIILETSASPILDDNGHVTGYRGIDRDISAQERARQDAEVLRDRLSGELRDTAALLEGVLNAIPDAITVMSPGRQVLRQNRAAAGFGFAPAPGTTLDCFQRFHRDSPCEPCIVTQTLAARGPVQFARHLPELNRWIDARGYPLLNDQGHVSLVIEHLRDITHDKQDADERRAMDERLRHTQKLESLGALAGGIAHDFNNLLVGVLGNADLALTMLPHHSDVRPLVDDIKEASRRAADLCRQMLAFSGHGRFIVAPIDITTLLHDMTPILEASITKKARLERKTEHALPLIEADAAQIRQIVVNLLTNASEALSPAGGVITLATGLMFGNRMTLDALNTETKLPEGPYVFLEVADTGSGMDPATRERMFEPFFSTKFTGRGLGLAAVLGIVRAHHGAIHVESIPGRGTSVRILFPAFSPAVTAAVADAPAQGKPPWTGHGVVLLVDDEPLVRDVGARMLTQLGYRVEVAGNGEEALHIVAERLAPFDAVILDLTMPRLDGAQTLTALRARQPALRVVLSSGYSEQDATARTPEAKWTAFLQKPYQLDALRKVMQELAATATPAAPASSQA
jgi:PAS domain S-box-containing protein